MPDRWNFEHASDRVSWERWRSYEPVHECDSCCYRTICKDRYTIKPYLSECDRKNIMIDGVDAFGKIIFKLGTGFVQNDCEHCRHMSYCNVRKHTTSIFEGMNFVKQVTTPDEMCPFITYESFTRYKR